MKDFKFIILSLFLASMSYAQSRQTTETSYLFSCAVSRDGSRSIQQVYVAPEKPKAVIDLDYGLVVELEQIDKTRMAISILHDGQPASTPTLMEGSQVAQLAMSAGGVTLNCYSQVQE